jgi:hypothetical protein
MAPFVKGKLIKDFFYDIKRFLAYNILNASYYYIIKIAVENAFDNFRSGRYIAAKVFLDLIILAKTLIQSDSVTEQKKNLRLSSYIAFNLFQLRYKALRENINNFNKKLREIFEYIQKSDELEILYSNNSDKEAID